MNATMLAITVALVVTSTLIRISNAGDQIDLVSVEQMKSNVDGLLSRLACVDPVSAVCTNFTISGKIYDDSLARYWLHVQDQAAIENRNRATLGQWNYETNISAETTKAKTTAAAASSRLMSTVDRQIRLLYTDDLDYTSKRILKFIFNGGSFSSHEHARMARQAIDSMSTIYATGQVCRPTEQRRRTRKRPEICLRLEPGLSDLMTKSRDYDELLWAWQGWRDAVGPRIGRLFPTYVALENEAARNGGYADRGAQWRADYEDPRFIEEIDELWTTMKPVYDQLHAYVRYRLSKVYGSNRVNPRGPIPAHLLGNMWAQKWGQIFDLLEPYPGHGTVDVSGEMVKQGWTVERIFHTSDRFFRSLGLEAMPDTFWTKSMLKRPRDRQVECHGSANDFFKDRDVRIKMCTEINMEDLYVAHHEMGHCQYFLQYRHQPAVFRTSANPGFHEAVGDTVALSVETPSYLYSLGLLSEDQVDHKLQINFLMRMALNKIAFLPFGLLIDKWRWRVFSGDITPENYNKEWWNMRRHYQGLASPIRRGPDDFDPGAKYHVAANVPYIRYFVSFLIQFQFQKALCKEAGNQGPLHLCNIYSSDAAGTKLASMLRMGKSRPWQDAMEILTGQRRMDAQPIIEYFKPLTDWLISENQKNNVYIGWE